MPSTFQHQLLRHIALSLQSFPDRNIDTLRHPQARQGPQEWLLSKAASFGWYRHPTSSRENIDRRLAELEPHIDGLDWLYQRLADNTSRQTLVEVMAFRVMGPRHARIQAVHDRFWQAAQQIQDPAVVTPKTQSVPMLDGWLDDYNLASHGWPVKLRAHKLNVLNTYYLEQYRFQALGIDIQAQAGDVIIDGGGCWGDTALYFAIKTGAKGAVHTFEFSPANLQLMASNLEQNPDLARCIQLQQAALWHESDQELQFDEAGPGTNLGSGGMRAATLSIDDWASRSNAAKVDFIKLDIEGAERQALQGARNVIQTLKPTLAVALYHSLDDFTKLPQAIDALHPGYRFHLGHYTIHSEETILFAKQA
jgi:FkbM family methyltransferase